LSSKTIKNGEERIMNKQKAFFLFSLVIIASLVLAACGPANTGNENMADNTTADNTANTANDTSDNASTDDASTDDAAMFEYPFKNPDTYVYVSFGEPETLDPHWTYETSGSAIQNNVYEGLVWFNRERTDSFVPMLSTGWEVNDAGTVWTFNVREGVTFQAGGTLEPHDVAYSMQRALLQDRIDGPHWMTHEAFFGTYSMIDTLNAVTGGEAASVAEASAEDLVAACEAVKAVAVADDAAGTVTFTLPAPTPWFMALLANNFIGNVLDQEWMADNGDWDGSCDTWQAFNDPEAQESILFNQMNGTGPYMLDHWTPGEEIVLVANPNYWRAEGDPVWEGGPSGVARIDRFVFQIVEEWGTRLAMFEAGDADFVSVDAQYNSQVEPFYGTVCNEAGECEAGEPGGWITAHVGIQRPAMTPAQFNQGLNSEGGNVFQGSGALDGNGIPDDFFADVHIRRAFSYCFDYATTIAEVLDGEGAQAQGPIIAGMMGYRDDGYVFSYDPAKCEEEFKASESGVWDTGFYMQIAYNTGNDSRRLAAEILKAGIEAVNPNFQIQVVGMPWPVLLNARRASKLPIYVGGWLEDFHDPHNWVHPFLHSGGAYGRVANIQEPLSSELDAMIQEAASLTDAEARRVIYEELQLIAQEEAVMIWMYQPLVRIHFSPWIQGWYYNAAYPGAAYSYIYALDKVGP
jgi:peptide/nickel transport system substrate-binding protein